MEGKFSIFFAKFKFKKLSITTYGNGLIELNLFKAFLSILIKDLYSKF